MTITVETPLITGSPLDDAQAQLREATTILGYDQGLHVPLATPRREVTVSIPLRTRRPVPVPGDPVLQH
jgi:glutamate dehydrogenase (NAD(P)+)